LWSKIIFVILAALGIGVYVYIQILQARAIFQKVESGPESFPGSRGKARTRLDPEGSVFVRGELWKARCTNGITIERDEPVEIIAREGMQIIVKQIN
jgi:membrane-bound serine protease (ClpP class)